MKNKLTAALLILILLLTAVPPVQASALENEEVTFECIGAFSEGLAWVRYEDMHAKGLGVINEDYELVYAFNEEEAQNAFRREKEDKLEFEVYPFRDGLAYYQAEGYGYVIVDDEGRELGSDIWTAARQPYIMARGEDYFMVREYDVLDECWYVYAINAHGKIKGKRASYEDKPEYRYIGSGLFIGTGGEDEEVFFSEDDKKTYENDLFRAGDFYGFSDEGKGFVFLDGAYDRAYLISKEVLEDEEKLEDWAEDPDWFEADESTVEFYEETAGSGMFYSAYDEAYLDYEGNTAVELPDFGIYDAVGFGRFQNGAAPVLLINSKGTYYVTYIDEQGKILYEPVQIGKSADGSVPVLTDRFFTGGLLPDDEDDTAYVGYGDGKISSEFDYGLVLDVDGSMTGISSKVEVIGADQKYTYLNNGLISLEESRYYNVAAVTEDTAEADLDWLWYANFAGIYDGSDGTVIVLLADGTGYYREPQTTTKEDLLKGVGITFEVSEGTLSIYNLAYVIYANVTDFEGSMLMLASDPGWHEEEFTRRGRDKEVPISELLDPDAKLPTAPPQNNEEEQGGKEPDQGLAPHVDPYLYGLKDFSFRLPQFWVDRGCTVRINGENNLSVLYRGVPLIYLYVCTPEEYTSGDPSSFAVKEWTLANGNYVVLWIENYAYHVSSRGEIPPDPMYGGPKYTLDGDLEDILYTLTAKDFDISKIKGKLDFENPNADVKEALNGYADFFTNHVIPAVTIY